MRIVLLDGNGQPLGPPSAAVSLMRGRPQRPATEIFASVEKLKAEEAALTAKASVFEVKILAHKPVTFPIYSKWGCVKVLKNPSYGKLNHPLVGYKPGGEYCPPKDPQYYEKSTLDWVLTGLGGYLVAYDGLAHFFDEAKHYIASKFAKELCAAWLGKKLESDCESAAAQIAEAAMSVGLAAAGVPPTLPDLAALQDMAEGKIVDASADYTSKAIESNGGNCTPELRAMLAKQYKQAFDNIRAQVKRQGKEPDCGNKKEADARGLIPLPCFTDYPGVDVKAAAGSIYEASTVTVRVSRVKPDPDFPMPACNVYVSMYLTNFFQGALLGGVHVKPSNIEGMAFVPAESTIPLLSVGKSMDIPLVFTQIQQYGLPGMHDPHWGYVGWQYLYIGGKGSLSAGSQSGQQVKLPTGTSAKIGCGTIDTWSVEIPITK